MNILKQKERKILEAVDLVIKSGKKPSVRTILVEVKKGKFGIKSTRSVFLYLNALQEKGYITKNPMSKEVSLSQPRKMRFIDIPIYGGANAGEPNIFSDEYLQGTVKVSKKIIGNRKVENIFAVEISGNSMNKAIVDGKTIENGDFVLVDRDFKDFLGNGSEKVVATIDGLATIKTYKRINDSMISLLPESSEAKHKPIFISPQEAFVINGKVFDVLKT
jgi:SOS-response transcriptional repressor LexA